MARGKKKHTLAPAIIILNVAIVGVICLLLFLVYQHITESAREEQARQEAALTSVATVYTTSSKYAAQTTTTTTTAATTTTERISMTKASTTTLPPMTTVEGAEDEAVSVQTTLPPSTYDPASFENDLFIGDSISTGFSGYGYLPAANVFALVGLNPESVLTKEIDGYTAKSKTEELKPAHIFIMLGTNGMAYMGSTYMANMMSDFIDQLKSVSDAKIVIMSIPPVTADHDANKAEKIKDIKEYNALLEQLAEKKGCEFAYIYDLLADDDGYLAAAYAEQDGLHFLGAAYGTVLNYLEENFE